MSAGDLPAGDDPLLPDAAPPIRLQALGGYAMLFAAVQFLGKGISFFMLPVYTRYLTAADYGVIDLIELSLDVLTIIAGARLLAGVFRFYYKTDDPAERRRVVSTALLTIWGGYIIAAAVAFALAPLASRAIIGDRAHTGLFRLAAVNMCVLPLTFVPPAFLRLQGRFPMLIGIIAARLVVQVALNVVFLVVLHLGPASIFLSSLAVNVLTGGVMAVILFRAVGFAYDRRVAGDLYRFGAPLMITQIATFILTFGDRPFLRVASDLASVGRYTLAYQFAFLLATLAQTPFDLVWEPKKFEVANRPENDRNALYARVFRYENVLLFTLAVGLSLFVHVVLVVMTRPAFYAAADVVPVLLVAIIFQTWTAAQDIGINIREQTKYIAYANWIAAGVAVLGYATLIPRYAGWGAAMATAIAYAVRWGATYAWSQHVWRVQWEWEPVRYLVAVSVATVLASEVIRAPSLAVGIVIRAGLFIVFLALVWRLPILSPDDRAAVRRLARPGTVLRMRRSWHRA